MLLLDEIIKATGGRVLTEGPSSFKSLSIDSRTIKDGEIFLAIKGQRFDGHDFIDEALKKCDGAIINEDLGLKSKALRVGEPKTIILVKDTFKALQAIATFLRKERIKVLIGITGSNGKTTTKEMLSHILSYNASVIKNEGNLNNEIGLPLSLIRESSRHEDLIDYGIFEMGASRPGDIRLLSEISRPDYGVITSIGHAHLEGMGGIKGVFRTKTEIGDFVRVLFINGDDETRLGSLGMSLRRDLSCIRFGLSDGCDVRASEIELYEGYSTYMLDARLELKDLNLKVPVRLNLPGMGNIYNSLASISVALYLGIPIEIVKKSLEGFRGVKMRLEIKEKDGARFIVDAYNANPDSMRNAIHELMRFRKTRAIAVLGDMLELGPYSEALHRELGRFLYEAGVDVFIGVGPQMRWAYEEFLSLSTGSSGSTVRKQVEGFITEDIDVARHRLYAIIKPHDTVLVKGSRLMAMERILEEPEYAR